MHGKFAIATQFAEAYPQQAARILEELLPTNSSAFIDAVPDGQSVGILAAMLPYHAAKCISLMAASSAAKYLSGLDPKIAANILRHIETEKSEAILGELPRRQSIRIAIILNYSPSMVGAWLEPNVLTLPSECTVREAKQRLINERYMDFHRIYIVDQSGKVTGFVKLVHLFGADEASVVQKHAERFFDVLRASTSLDAALEHPAWSKSDYLPVVDRQRKFLGVLRYAALRSAISRPTSTDEVGHDVSTTILDLAETCYLGLAEVMSASLASENQSGAGKRR